MGGYPARSRCNRTDLRPSINSVSAYWMMLAMSGSSAAATFGMIGVARILLFSWSSWGRDRNYSQRATGTTNNFQRCSNDNRAGRRKLVKIAQARQTKLSTAMHKVMVGERWIESGSLASISSDRLYTYPQDVALLGKQR